MAVRYTHGRLYAGTSALRNCMPSFAIPFPFLVGIRDQSLCLGLCSYLCGCC